MKKVLIVSLVGLGYEGITSVIYNYCSNMDTNGLELNFVSFDDATDEINRKFSKLGKLHKIANRKTNFIKYTKNLNNILKKDRYDVVHIHGNSGTMAIEAFFAKLHGIKKIIVHSHNTQCDHPHLNLILAPIMRNMATDYLACSDASGKWLYGNKKFTVVNNAIDTERFRFNQQTRDECRKEFGLTDEFVIGHVGVFTEQKNHDFLIDIFNKYNKIYSNSKLVLISDGPKLEKIKEKVADYGLSGSVIFAGRRNDVERLYLAMDLFVFPSKWEGLPLTLIEAQTSGLYCLASEKVSKNSDLTGNIMYLPIDNALLWKDAINKIYNNESERGQLSEMNIRKISLKGYDIKTEAKKLRELYFE